MSKEKTKKTEKIKVVKQKNEDQEMVERFIKIILILLVATVVIYIFTKLIVTKEVNKNEIAIHEGTIDYNKLIVGNVLNQNHDEYYVFVYNGNNTNAIYYSSIIDKYTAKKDAMKVYWIDLANKLNEKFIANNKSEINLKATLISDFKFGEYTLLKIKNKEVVKAVDNIEDAKKELKIND